MMHKELSSSVLEELKWGPIVDRESIGVSDVRAKQPRGSGRTDEDIARAAAQALAWNIAVPHDGQVKITVTNGYVILDGEVNRPVQRTAAEHAVRLLHGVKGVFNLITTRPKLVAKDLKSKIEQAMGRNAEVDAGTIQITAHDLQLVLQGSVRSWEEWEEVDRVAWSAPGVCEVVNELVVDP